MTDFARKFAIGFGVLAFGVAGFVSIAVGAGAITAMARALIAGLAFYLFGRVIAYALFYDPDYPPKPPVMPSAKPGEEKKGE